MNYFVYILYSRSLEKYYTGISKHPDIRLKQHKGKGCHWAQKAEDWVEVLKEEVSSSKEARGLEKKIKRRGAKRYLESLQT